MLASVIVLAVTGAVSAAFQYLCSRTFPSEREARIVPSPMPDTANKLTPADSSDRAGRRFGRAADRQAHSAGAAVAMAEQFIPTYFSSTRR